MVRIVGAFVAELHHPRAAAAVSGDSHLERDFSMHSVERLELVLRLEEAFGIQVPDHAASSAESVGDLARLVSGRPAEDRSGRKLSAADTRENHVEAAPGSLAFTVYAALLVLCVGSVVWVLLLVLPGERLPGRVLRRASRALLRASGCPLDVQGLEHLEHPALLVANHQSYLDAVVLLATLPVDVKIVVNERLPRWPLIGTAIRRARHLVVDRTARDPRLACAAMAGALRAGESLLVFPEGTFADRAQLLPFRLGGFSAAVEARRPVVPVALRGTRHILPASRWLLARGPLSVTIHPAIRPRGPGWEETLRLREEARASIAQSVSTGRDDPG
ncbi:MAG: 1-acyl-sn-glycerol-3-phosphate acyltransferase [Acidobacteria bacterium]|nr:1-acyl-sn-glycerol-3-phosphate acyltransferase [Acidobacteriota bacterium]